MGAVQLVGRKGGGMVCMPSPQPGLSLLLYKLGDIFSKRPAVLRCTPWFWHERARLAVREKGKRYLS